MYKSNALQLATVKIGMVEMILLGKESKIEEFRSFITQGKEMSVKDMCREIVRANLMVHTSGRGLKGRIIAGYIHALCCLYEKCLDAKC